MPEEICQCDFCKNYVRQIKFTYPQVARFLNSLGVDIEKPFETIPLEPENGYLDYLAAQYIAMGTKKDFQGRKIDGVNVEIETCHPSTDIPEEHFIISIFPIRLKWLFSVRGIS